MFRKSETESATSGFLSTVKKLFAIAFTCVYLTLTVGVAQTTHYCMGRVKSSALFSFETAKCPCYLFAGENDSCCKDTHEVLKIDDDHAASSVVSIAPIFFEIAIQFIDTKEYPDPITFYYEESPPPGAVPLFTRHCSLIFYDDEMTA